MRIHIIRHADPDYARDTITPAGHEEARVLAQYLQTLQIEQIFASPFGRTKATAGYTSDLLNLPVQIEPWMCELERVWIQDLDRAFLKIVPGDGTFEQEPPREGGLRLYQNDPCLMQENMERIRVGADAFLRLQRFARARDIYRVTRENHSSIAVFTHMGVSLVWLAHLLNVPLPVVWSGFFLHPASVTTIVMDERVPGYAAPRCIGLGDISHLCRAGIQPRPVGMAAKV